MKQQAILSYIKEDIYLPVADWLYTKIRMHKHMWPQIWMYMDPSVCFKRIHQFSLQPVLLYC